VNKEETKMHKKSIVMFGMIALMIVTTLPVFAVKPAGPSSSNGLKKGKNDHLYLYEKDPQTWDIVEDPAWAKMNINIKKNKFVYNAHGLNPDTEYELICYQDPWPGTGSLLLGNDITDAEGNVHIMGSINVTDLPSFIYETEEEDFSGSKIWLVLADDYNEITTELENWNPTEYLFEYDLLNKEII
jgi:hypothetical protein